MNKAYESRGLKFPHQIRQVFPNQTERGRTQNELLRSVDDSFECEWQGKRASLSRMENNDTSYEGANIYGLQRRDFRHNHSPSSMKNNGHLIINIAVPVTGPRSYKYM
jgi:hypothetical protein